MPLSALHLERLRESTRLIRSSCDVRAIDDVADRANILLVRTDGPRGKDAGIARVDFLRAPAYVESLARPGESIKLLGLMRRIRVRSITINKNAGIPEAEIFWHEFYHLAYSPTGVDHAAEFVHHYSSVGALHYREERRANQFAALVLVPEDHGCATAAEICERYNVSPQLSEIAAELLKGSEYH